jgi:hypothetical protein
MNRAGLDGRRLTDLLASFDWDLAEHEWHGFFDHGCALCLIAGCDCDECTLDGWCDGRCLIWPRRGDVARDLAVPVGGPDA